MITLNELITNKVFAEIVHTLPYSPNIFRPDNFEVIFTNNLIPEDINIPRMACRKMIENFRRPLDIVKRDELPTSVYVYMKMS
ncbi:MAG: hypothetical protein NTX05_04180 [Fusobacteria bacterium]|nr:hypothetical protein [Fusobacteriota bacterium]